MLGPRSFGPKSFKKTLLDFFFKGDVIGKIRVRAETGHTLGALFWYSCLVAAHRASAFKHFQQILIHLLAKPVALVESRRVASRRLTASTSLLPA